MKFSVVLVVFIVFLLSLCFIDIPLAFFINDNVCDDILNIFEKITLFGSFLYISISNIAVLLYLFFKQYFIKNAERQEVKIVLCAIMAQSITALSIQLLKFIFGRIRPLYFLKNFNDTLTFTFFNYHDDFASFPSGHSAGIWAFITCLLIVFKNNKYSKFLIIFGILVSISRLMLNVHFLSDILIGSLLGILISKMVLMKLLNHFVK